MLLDKCNFLDPRLCGKYAMDKDEVACQLKQETVAVLEKAATNYLAEKPEGSRHPKKKRKRLSAILHYWLKTIFSQGGNIINTLWNRLSGKHVNMLIFQAKIMP